MTYLDNYADLEKVESISSDSLEFIEDNLFRFAVPEDIVIKDIIGEGTFALDLDREFFEMHLYDRDTDQLVTSISVPFSEGYLYIREGAEEGELRLGLTFWTGDTEDKTLTAEERAETLLEKYLADVPAGEYNVFVHFFGDELGTYNQDEWQIKAISDSRTEIILERNPTDDSEFNVHHYKQFAFKSIFGSDFEQIIKLLFETDNPQTYNRLITDFQNRLVDLQNNLYASTKNQANSALRLVFKEIMERIFQYIEQERQNKRFRIVRVDFREVLRTIVYDTVAMNLNLFPDPGVSYTVDERNLPDPPVTGDTGGTGEPPRSDNEDGQVPGIITTTTTGGTTTGTTTGTTGGTSGGSGGSGGAGTDDDIEDGNTFRIDTRLR